MAQPGRTVTISHLGRVEGHGGIHVRIVGDVVHEVNMDIFEGSRYYEALLKGKHFLEVQGIITRVCAICSSNHTVAALTALEKALGVGQSPRIHHLRGLLVLGATVESHALHIFALALTPDFLGFDSVISMSAKFPKEVAFALKLKQLGNRIRELVGGRAIHPINTLVGGFGRLPGREALLSIRNDLAAALDPLMGTVELVATLPLPEWAAQDTVYVALRPLSAMVLKWKGTFERDELPIDGRYPDAVQDFMTWLEDQPYGYLVPHPGRMGVGDLPIYDVVVTPNIIG